MLTASKVWSRVVFLIVWNSEPSIFVATRVLGVRHEGQPEGLFCALTVRSSQLHDCGFIFLICISGKFEQIAGVKCYVATPKGDYSKDKVILYMLDAFGLSLQNNLVCVLILYT